MNLDTFFEKFDLFADAPNAVAKMRELILDLATSGRLSEHIDGTWEERSLGDVIELISGQHLLADEHNTQGRGIPYLTGPADFGPAHPVPTRWTETPKVVAEPGDILITVKGAGIGKTNVLIGQKTAISRQLMAIRVRGADPEFIHLTIRRAAEVFQESKTGIAIPGIGRKDVLGLKIKIPPLAEQKRIVAKVDELMALCDRLEAQQQQRETRHTALAQASLTRFADAPTTANLELLFHKAFSVVPSQLRKTIIDLAVQGRLISQNTDDGTAAAFVHQLQIQRRDSYEGGRIAAEKAHTRPPKRPSNDFNAYVSEQIEGMPTGWCETRIGDIAECLDYLRVPVNKAERLGDRGEIPYYGANGQVGWIDKYLFNEPLVLVVEDETFIGRVKPFSYMIYGKSWVNNHAHVLRPLTGMSAEYLNLCLCQYPFIPLTSGTTGRRKLTQASLLDAKLWVAPPPEQKRIVAKVEQLMGLVDRLEAQLAESRAKATALLDAVVAELSAAA